MKYNKLIEGSITKFTRIGARAKDFLVEDSEQKIHKIYLSDSKNELDALDNILIIGTYKSGDKIKVDYIINKTKNYEEKFSESKAEWQVFTSIILTLITTGAFFFFLLSILGIIPIQITFGWEIYGEFYGMISNILILLPLFTLMVIFVYLIYSHSRHNKRLLERDNEIKRIKERRNGKVKTPMKEIKKEKAEVSEEEAFCSHCGEVLPIGAEFCSKCGAIQ